MMHIYKIYLFIIQNPVISGYFSHYLYLFNFAFIIKLPGSADLFFDTLKENKFAYAQKNEPTFPFNFMKIIWLYTEVDGGIKMTWIQDFEMHPDFKKLDDEGVCGLINKHSQENLKIFKDIIEKEAKVQS